MLASEVFVLRDDVQFVRNHKYPNGSRDVSYQAHTRIKGPAGAHLLAVSVKNDGLRPIRQVRVSYEQPWARKHLHTLKRFYGSSPNFRRLWPEIELLLSCRFATIAELDIATTCWALGHLLGEALRIPEQLAIARINELLAARRTVRLRQIVLGSDLGGAGADELSTATERIVALCRAFGADEYVGGGTAVQAYLDTALFHRHGIKLTIQNWSCPDYLQQHNDSAGFVGNLSLLDLLMNAPAGKAMSLLGSAGPFPSPACSPPSSILPDSSLGPVRQDDLLPTS
jgi:hypothetical protein